MVRVTFIPPYRATGTLKDEARVVFIRKGNSKFYSPSGSLIISAGDCMVMKCENFVNQWEENLDHSESQIIAFSLHPKVLKHIYQDHLPDMFIPPQPNMGSSLVRINPELSLKHFVNSLEFYFDNPHLISEELLTVKLRELVFLISRLQENPEIKQVLKSLFSSTSYLFKNIIQSNLYENLRIEELAFLCGLSLSSFQRKFQETFNTSPARYIRNKRIEKAKYLLKTSNSRISEIAFSTGFESVAHFSRTFRTICHCSPSDYRTANQ